MPDLPGAVHLISQVPQPDIMRFSVSVLNPQVAPIGTGRKITVFHQIPCGIRPSCPQIHRHHHIRACPAAPFAEFIRAHLVVFHSKPGQLRTLRPLLLRPDTVLPIVSGYEIAAGITHNRYLQLSGQVNHIPAEPHIICQRMTGIVNPSVYRPADMLDERSV